MAKASTYNPIWKDVALPLLLPIIIAIATSGYFTYQKQLTIEKKADTIHELVNSRVTKLQEDFTALMNSNSDLKQEVLDLKKTIADLRNDQ